MNTPYIAEVTGCEVGLRGHVDLSACRTVLANAGLHPFASDERAEIAIGAIATRYMGMAFSEIVVSIQASHDAKGATRDGAFLLQGYSTSRLFAFFEEHSFRTPYRHASLTVSMTPSASFLGGYSHSARAQHALRDRALVASRAYWAVFSLAGTARELTAGGGNLVAAPPSCATEGLEALRGASRRSMACALRRSISSTKPKQLLSLERSEAGRPFSRAWRTSDRGRHHPPI